MDHRVPESIKEARLLVEKNDSEFHLDVFWHLENKEFTCEDDAANALKLIKKGLKYHDIFAVINVKQIP